MLTIFGGVSRRDARYSDFLSTFPLRGWLGIFVVVENSDPEEFVGMLKMNCSLVRFQLILKLMLGLFLTVLIVHLVRVPTWPLRTFVLVLVLGMLLLVLLIPLVLFGHWFMSRRAKPLLPLVRSRIIRYTNRRNLWLIVESGILMLGHYVYLRDWLASYIPVTPCISWCVMLVRMLTKISLTKQWYPSHLKQIEFGS